MAAREPILVIELNEFNVALLERAANALDLPNIKRFLSWKHSTTLADQELEHQGLDPWCQWVSIHTETPSSVHGIIRLGDVDKLKHAQIWDRLGRSGVTTGVWGVMNANRQSAPNNVFFASDAWNFTERPHPLELEGFFALPIYYSKSYMDLSVTELLGTALKTARSLFKTIRPTQLLADTAFLLKTAIGAQPGTYFLFGAFELYSTRIFLELRREHDPDVCFIFLNLVAHFQHHEWRAGTELDAKARVLFTILDRILGLLLDSKRAQRTLVINAFSQKNVSEEEHYCYRQINPLGFLQSIGLEPVRVEQCMTNDGHAFFEDAAARARAEQMLRAARVEGVAAFDVELDPVDRTKLFYQFAYWGPASESTTLEIDGRSLPLFECFKLHAKRTGAHVREGDVYADGIELPEHVDCFDLFREVWPTAADRPLDRPVALEA